MPDSDNRGRPVRPLRGGGLAFERKKAPHLRGADGVLVETDALGDAPKPAVKTSFNRFTRARAWLINSRGELLKRYEEAVNLVGADVVLIQQMIPGGNENQFSYAALYSDGQPIASLVARRTKQFPVDFGQGSSLVETEECDEVERAGERLLGAIRYTGIVEVVVRDLAVAAQEVWSGRLTPESYLRSVADASSFAIFSTDDPVPALLEIPLLFAYRWRTSLGGRMAPSQHLK